MAEDLMYLSLKEPVPDLEGVDRGEVIRILRRVTSGDLSKIGRTIVTPRRAQIALLRIGDDQEIAKVVEAFRNYDTRYALAGIPKAMEYAHQPKLIPHLAEDFFRDEDPEEFIKSRAGQGPADPTIVASPRSIYAGVIAMRIVSKDPSFSDETRQWADQMQRLRTEDASAFQKTMRGWWKANAKFFESGEYEKVSSNTSVESDEELLAAEAAVGEAAGPAAPREQEEPAPLAADKRSEDSPLPQERRAGAKWLAASLLALLGLLAASLLARRMRSGKERRDD